MTDPQNHVTFDGWRAFFAQEIQAWHGHAPLARVFWLRGVLASVILMVLYATTVLLEQTLAEQVLVVFFTGYTLWILVAIWRCSEPANSNWRVLARMLTVAWAGNTALVLTFRQLELMTRYF